MRRKETKELKFRHSERRAEPQKFKSNSVAKGCLVA
jgi:hypothetical protein